MKDPFAPDPALVAALRQAHAALVMMTQPDAIKKTTVAVAYAVVVEAEAATRRAIEAVETPRRSGPRRESPEDQAGLAVRATAATALVIATLSAHAPTLPVHVIKAAAVAAGNAAIERNRA